MCHAIFCQFLSLQFIIMNLGILASLRITFHQGIFTMKNSASIYQAFVIFILAVVLFPAICISQTGLVVNKKKGYVIDFTLHDGKMTSETALFTEEFEEALIQTGLVDLLQRRYYDKLFSQLQNERGIMRLEDVPQAAIDTLKSLEASFFIFGVIAADHIEEMTIKITVTAQNFDGKILAKESTSMDREKIYDKKSRRMKMNELVESFSFLKGSKTDKPKYKPPVFAGWLGFYPGVGHIYAGEMRKGILVGATFACGIWLIVASGYDVETDETEIPALFYSGVTIMSAALFYSIIDAVNAAKRANKKNGYTLRKYSVEPYFATGSNNNQIYGIKISFKL